FDSAPVKVSLPLTIAAVSAVIWPAVNEPPLHTSVGVPLIEAVSVSPTSASLTGSEPLIGDRSCAEAFANSATEPGWAIGDSTGALLTGVMLIVTLCCTLLSMPSLAMMLTVRAVVVGELLVLL